MDFKNKKFLVVDDEESLLVITAYYFKNINLAIKTVNSGKAALECLRQENYDVVISDVNMPIMRGDELIEKIKSEFPERQIACFFMTADVRIMEQEELYRHLVIDTLLKPFTIKDIKEFLEKNRSSI